MYTNIQATAYDRLDPLVLLTQTYMKTRLYVRVGCRFCTDKFENGVLAAQWNELSFFSFLRSCTGAYKAENATVLVGTFENSNLNWRSIEWMSEFSYMLYNSLIQAQNTCANYKLEEAYAKAPSTSIRVNLKTHIFTRVHGMWNLYNSCASPCFKVVGPW